MSTITKERIELFIKNPLDNGLTRGEQMELARIALASLEAEAIAVRARWKDEGSGHGDWRYYNIAHRDALMADETRECELIYTAPPAPVAVPDEMTPKQASRSYCGEVRGYRDGWNACRDAMIQAGNSTVIPDGWVLVPKEITCEMDDAAWEAYHETRCMSDILAALIAAAPQQEDL